MPMDKIIRNIPEEYKEKIPLYGTGRLISRELRKERKIFRDKQLARSFAKDKRFIPYEDEIKKFHNIHKGERCFILATGPSLKNTNVKLLKDEILFGVNTLFRGMKEIGIKKVDYYAVSDVNQIMHFGKEQLALDTNFFLRGKAARMYLSKKEEYEKYQKKEPILIRSLGRLLYNGWKVKDITKGTYGTHLVPSCMCLQITYYLGFKEVWQWMSLNR